MTENEVVELMESSNSSEEWNENCNKVKKAFDGWPPFWYSAIILSGVATKTTAKWGSDAGIHIIYDEV